MSKYNICYWSTPQDAWNSIKPEEEYYYGDNLISIVDKTDTQVTIEYKYDGRTRKLSKKQALRCLQR